MLYTFNISGQSENFEMDIELKDLCRDPGDYHHNKVATMIAKAIHKVTGKAVAFYPTGRPFDTITIDK